MIKHNSPSIKKKYLAKVNERLLSNNLTTGDAIKKVENFFNKKYYKSGSSCLTSSGSSALYLAIMSLSKKKKPKDFSTKLLLFSCIKCHLPKW